MHLPPLELGLLLHCAGFGAQLGKAVQKIETKRRMGDLTAAEADGDLDLVAALQEAAGMADLNVQVANVNIRRQADLLDLNDTLVFARFFLALCLFKAEFAVIHDAAHRGLSLRRDLDKIHALLDGDIERFFRGYDTQLLAGIRNQANLFVTDIFIDLMFHTANAKAPPNELAKMKKDGKPSVQTKAAPPRCGGGELVDPVAARCG